MTTTDKPAQKRGRRAGVEDRWTIAKRDPVTGRRMRSTKYGKGNRWQGRFVDADGHEHMKTFALKDDAQQWVDQNTADLVTGKFVRKAAGERTVGEVAEQWIDAKAARKPKTVAGYRSLLDTCVLPTWRDTPLAGVDFAGVRAWVLAMQAGEHAVPEGARRRALSASRVIQAHQVLRQVLGDAVRLQLLPSNPADGVELPRKTEASKRFLDHAQVEALADAMPSPADRVMVYVLAYAGLRYGEAVALRRVDVNLTDGRLDVARSVTWVREQGAVEGTTKGHESRSVPVPAFLVELLRDHLDTLPKATGTLVFGGRDGWMTPGEFRWRFDPAATAAGVEGLTPHELRHTAASLAIRSGANVKVVQRMLGHKSATLTLDRYGHLFSDELDALATALNDARTAALKPAESTPDIGQIVAMLDLSADQISRLSDLLAST
ncbi:tyrosine-type recombinase/integrase [Gordonia sputi]